MWRNLAELDTKASETPLYRKTSQKEAVEEEAFTGMNYDEIISDFVQQRKMNGQSPKSQDPPSSSAKKMTASALNHQEKLRQLEKTRQLGLKIRKMGELIDLMQRLAQRGQWMESEQIMNEVLRRSEDGFVRDEIGYDGLLDGYRSAAIFYYHHALIWEAEEMYDRCVDVRDRAELYYSVPHHPPPLSPLLPIAQYRDELQRLQNLTQQMLQKMHEIIRSLMDAGSHTEAERYLRSALNKLRSMDDPNFYERRMVYMVDLVAILYEMQRVEEAWSIIEEAITFSSKHLGPTHQYTGLAYSHYGLLLGSQRRLEEAETSLLQALSILQTCDTASPLMMVQAMISVSDVQVLQFRLDDAESMLTTAQTLHLKTFGRESVQVQARLNEFSTEKGFANLVRNVLSAFSDGRVEEALFGMECVAGRCRQILGKEHPETLKIHLHWAKLLLRCETVDGSFEKAKEIAEELLPLMERVFGEDDCDVTMDTCRTLAQSYVRLGRRSAAMRLIQRVVETQTQLLGPGHPLTLDSKYGLFECLFQLGRLDEGQKVLGDFLQHMDGISPEGRDRILAVISPLLAFLKTKESRSEFLVGCAEKLLQNQQFEDAEFIFLEQLRLREEMYLEEAKYRKTPLHRLYSTRTLSNDHRESSHANEALSPQFQEETQNGDKDANKTDRVAHPVSHSDGLNEMLEHSQMSVIEEEDLSDSCEQETAADETAVTCDAEKFAHISETTRLAATRLVPDSVSMATAQHLSRLLRFVGRNAEAEYLAEQLVMLREEFWGPWDKKTTDARLFVDFIRSPQQTLLSSTAAAAPSSSGAHAKNGFKDKHTHSDHRGKPLLSAAKQRKFFGRNVSFSQEEEDDENEDDEEEEGYSEDEENASVNITSDTKKKKQKKKQKKNTKRRRFKNTNQDLGSSHSPVTKVLSLTPEQRSLKNMIAKRERSILDVGTPFHCGHCAHCRVRRQRRNWAKIFRMFWIPIVFAKRVRILRPRKWR